MHDDGSGSSSSGSDSDSDSSSGSSSDSSSSSSSGSGSDAGAKKRRVLGKKNKLGGKRRQVRPKRAVKKRKAFGEEGGAARPKLKSAGGGGGGGESGDEYESGEDVKETAADREFIDGEGDDKALMREYKKERQDFEEDERPKKSRKGKGKGDSEDISGEKRTKSGKRKELSDEEKRDMVFNTLSTMRTSAAQDIADKKAGKPAVQKLKALAEVRAAVSNASLHEFLLEPNLGAGTGSAGPSGSILTAMREWLRPLPGSDLANVQLREAIYDMLDKFHIDGLDSELEKSRLGPILFALSEHPKETLGNKGKLKVLIDKVSRKIFDKQAGYRGAIEGMLQQQEALGLVSAPKGRAPAPAHPRPTAAASGSGGGGEMDTDLLVTDDAAMHSLLGGSSASALPGGAGGGGGGGSAAHVLAKDLPRHARIPPPLVFDYTRRPDAEKVDAAVKARLGSGATGLAKKMVEDKRKAKAGLVRGVKISIEGRGSNV